MSDLTQNAIEAESIRINQMVYQKQRDGSEVTVLSLGEAFFDIPLFDFRELDFVKGYHYSDTKGIPQLREKIANHYAANYGVTIDPHNQLMVSAGSKILVYMAILATINPGDEVLIPEPYWVSYPEQVKLARGIPAAIPFWEKSNNFAKYFTPKTKLVILNNPNNPAGTMLSPGDLREIYRLCRVHGATLLVDEAYSDFCLSGEFVSAASLDPSLKDIIVINSLSKNMGMSGWRIGYVMTHVALLDEMQKLNQHLITCAPTLLLQYAHHYFDRILEITEPQIREVVQKRERIAKYMKEIGLKALAGSSTFYFFVDIRDSQKNSRDYAEWLLNEHHIAVVPGTAYGTTTEGFVRVGVGAESEDDIKAALKIMASSLDQNRKSSRNRTGPQKTVRIDQP